MGRRKRRRSGVSTYFRQLYEQHPDWLEGESNSEMMDVWRQDHPGKEPDKRVPQNLANLKSLLRREIREGKRKSAPAGAAIKAGRMNASSHKLEGLEEAIDHCLTTARTLDRSGLDSVIKLLRRARNEVVWKIGQ